MAIERERKFLVNKFPNEYLCSETITQGYLMLDNGEQLRIRIVDGEDAYICYKKDISSGVKYEFEFEIPIKDAIRMFDLCKYKLHKTRYTIDTDADAEYQIFIDQYENGMLIAEVEFFYTAASMDFEKPDYLGEEITGKKEYSNIRLAINFTLEQRALTSEEITPENWKVASWTSF